MITCYTLLAVYLSSSGALDSSTLKTSFRDLKQTGLTYGQVTYEHDGLKYEDTFWIDKNMKIDHNFYGTDITEVTKCKLDKKTYIGAFNRYIQRGTKK